MNYEEYKRKLIEFNQREKYAIEMDFLCRQVEPISKEKILDYGCGTGQMVWHIKNKYGAECFGYDKYNFVIKNDEYVFRSEYFFQFDKIYFMHSFAHIEIGTIFNNLELFLKPGGSVYILTPNIEYLYEHKTPDYVPDPTVIRHYSLGELKTKFDLNGFKVIDSGTYSNNERIFLKATK